LSFYYPTFNTSLEPNQGNVRQWLDNLYSKFQPLEQCRWNQSNIDTLFYAGDQSFVNRQFNFAPTSSYQQYYFNLVQQPVNMVTGYERQHIKSFNYVPTDEISPQTTDQYTKLITNISNGNAGGIHHQKSKAKELATISGMVLVQPYLDFTTDDQAQGELKLKIWEYNSFIVDPYFRNPDMSDAQFVWCQEYISKNEAESRFPEGFNRVTPMAGSPQRLGNFYFLPENYNMARNDLLVLSYVWYKWKRKKKRLYSRKRNQFFDFAGGEGNLEQLLYSIDDLEAVTVDAPCWKLAVVLNDQLMFQGENPLGFDDCPFVPYFWNYDPHINNYNLRVRSLIRTMRDPQFLFNYKVIINNDITAATINAGWKRKVGAVANEDNLKKTGQGYDVIINEGYEMTDVDKIQPSGVPESDMALAQQMADLIYQTSGIQMENWSGQEDKQISALTALIKQAANLMVFQKYFDQWDLADKLLGNILIQIPLNNWNAEKVKLLIGEEPTPFFYSRVFAKYKVLVEESDLTPTQQNLQAQQMFEVNERFGREVFPPSKIIPKLNITGKAEVIEFLQQQEQQMQQQQQEQAEVQHMLEDAQIKQLYSKATDNIALARERNARAESNLGLFEERLSMIGKNRAMAVKDKVEALSKLVETVSIFGSGPVQQEENEIDTYSQNQETDEEIEKMQAKRSAEANKFLTEIMGSMNNQGQQQGQEMPQQSEPDMALMR
jgi:hypothetical protein